ncbi:VanZ like family protein (modular protein) [uncultured Desulfatiglans sp.]|uniref:VanZ like family protein (Modular protein) n=1 Tax=Uncultured Desulfatiglans sp. TaxID=1748965 RepID=A0A653A6U8_UNCDX|nr:VanZ like family protein (modular protein) [uncultured Desulfatiglans sp.]
MAYGDLGGLSARGEKSRSWCRWGLVIACVVFTVVAAVPYGRDAHSVVVLSVGLDKIVHLLGFAFLAVLAIGAGKGLLLWKRVGLVLLVLGFGAGIEWMQSYLPYRTFNPVDIVANSIGVAIGAVVGAAALQNGRRSVERASQ